jgi:hypothetical protein
MKKPRTPAEIEYHDQVAQLPCHLEYTGHCGGKLEVHHKTGAGMARRASHFDVIPLCFNHHSAQTPLPFGHAVHKGTRTFEQNYGSQDDMIAATQARLNFTPPTEE